MASSAGQKFDFRPCVRARRVGAYPPFGLPLARRYASSRLIQQRVPDTTVTPVDKRQRQAIAAKVARV